MPTYPDRIVVIGAGPVGLCLSLALAQADQKVCLSKRWATTISSNRCRAPAPTIPPRWKCSTDIGLYQKLEPRGIIAPVFHYWDRREGKLIAAFDHIHLKDDTRFPYVLQCERIKIVEEALAMAKAHPHIDVRLATEFIGFEQDADGVTAHVKNPAGEEETIAGRYIVSGEGARSIVRKELGIEFEGFTYADRTLNIEVAYDFRQHGYTERNYISDPDGMVEPVPLERPAGPLARAFPDRPRADELEADAAGGAAGAAATIPADRQAVRHRRQQSLHRASARGAEIPRRPRDPRRRFRPCEQPDRRHGHEQRHPRRLQSGRQAHRHRAREADDGVLDRYERQRRHVAVEHTQAQTIRNKRLLAEKDPAVRQAQPRRIAPHRGRSGSWRAQYPAAHVADRELARSRRDCVMTLREDMGTAMRRLAFFALLMTLTAVHTAAAQPAAWPERPIHLIVPFPAGSSSDIVARIVAQKLGERLGQQLVVENRPGASGNLGTEAVAHAAADGYTLGLANTSTHTLSPSLMAKPAYDPVKDFVPISMIGSFAVRAGALPRRAGAERAGTDRTRQDQAAQAHLRLGRPGDAGKSRRRPVRQDGAYRADAGILSRHRRRKFSTSSPAGWTWQFATIPPTLPLIRDGKVRAIAVTGPQRSPALADVPTVAESGLPGYESVLWQALYAPAGTPAPIVTRLNAEVNAILHDSAAVDALAKLGVDAQPGTAQQLADRIAADLKKWHDVIVSAGIQPQ